MPASSPAADVDEPVLVAGGSTQTSNTYRESGGSFTTEVYTAPVNYQDDSGDWEPIVNDFVATPGSTFDVQNAANDYTAQIPVDPAEDPIKFTSDDGWVSMRMHGLNGTADVDGSEVTFESVAKADEVTYEATDTGLKESIVLDVPPAAPSPLEYVYSLAASSGLEAELTTSGSVEFTRADGDVVATIPPGNMVDSAAPAGAYSEAVVYDLQPSGDGWTLTVTPDLEWLTSPARVYPVVVDPSLTNQPPLRDCYIRWGNPTANFCANDYIRAGWDGPGNEFRGLLDFNVSAIPSNATVTSASANLYYESSLAIGVGSNDYALHPAGKAFDSTATWNTSGANGGWTGGNPWAAAYGTRSLAGGGDGYKSFGGNLGTLIQTWVNNPANRRGLVLQQEGATNVVVTSHSSAGPVGKRPYLNVNYTVPNRTPSIPTEVTAGPGLDSLSVTSVTPTLSASATDLDGDPVSLRFEVRDANGEVDEGPLLWSTTTGFATSGTTRTVTVPSSILAVDDYFLVKVTATDGSATSGPANAVFVVEPEESAAELVTGDDLATVNATWDALLTCMKATDDDVSPDATVAEVLGSVAPDGSILPPSQPDAPYVTAACALGARSVIVEAIAPSTTPDEVDQAVDDLRDDLASGKPVPAIATDPVLGPPEATSGTKGDETLSGRPAGSPCSISIHRFFESLNTWSDVKMSRFIQTRNVLEDSNCIFNWTSDECSKSPNKGFGFNFTAACQRHDFGWRNLNRAETRYGNYNLMGLRNRNVADEQFKRDMKGNCSTQALAKKPVCVGVLNTIYQIVAVFSNTYGYGSPMYYTTMPPQDRPVLGTEGEEYSD